MPLKVPSQWRVYLDADMGACERVGCPRGDALVCVRKRPGRVGANEDAALVAPVDGSASVLMAADGAGGLPDGALAARAAVTSVAEALLAGGGGDLRKDLRDGLELAHKRIAAGGQGAATTANVVLIEDDRAWSFHVGDSITLVVDAAGRFKLRTVPHSPVGLKVRDGLLSEDQAIRHAELHLVHHLLGIGSCYIDPSAPVLLNPGDTIVVATDGLFDNLLSREVAELAKDPQPAKAAAALLDEAWRRMTAPVPADPSKPDDLALILYRHRGR